MLTRRLLHKHQSKQLVFIVGTLAISILTALWCYHSVNRFQADARESELRENLTGFASAEAAYFQEFQTYSDDPKAIGFVPEERLNGDIYLSDKNLPSDLKIPNSAKPYASKTGFRILLVNRNRKTGEVILWVVENEMKPYRISLLVNSSRQ